MNLKKILAQKVLIITCLLQGFLIFNGNLLGMLQCPIAQKPTQLNTQINTQKNGKVILLLGTSSSGKSRACQEVVDFASTLSEQVVSVVMDTEDDKGISMTIRRQFPYDWSSEQILLYQSILEHAEQNKTVISDLMLFESEEEDITESFINKLKAETNVFSILVYCPMRQLLRNVASRNTSPQDGEGRSPVNVFGQYLDMYFSPDVSDSDTETGSYSSIEDVENTEFIEGIENLSLCPVEPYETRSKTRQIERLQTLSRRPSSPALFNSNIYDLVLKNTGNNFEKNIGLIFYELFHWLK